jgi:hypothetical protein
VTLVDELTAYCAPACEAATFGRTCHHIRAARLAVATAPVGDAGTPRLLRKFDSEDEQRAPAPVAADEVARFRARARGVA